MGRSRPSHTQAVLTTNEAGCSLQDETLFSCIAKPDDHLMSPVRRKTGCILCCTLKMEKRYLQLQITGPKSNIAQHQFGDIWDDNCTRDDNCSPLLQSDGGFNCSLRSISEAPLQDEALQSTKYYTNTWMEMACNIRI